MVLFINTDNVFKQVLLPNINNTNFKINIDKSKYGTARSFSLQLEVVNRKWSISDSKYYVITCNHVQKDILPLAEGIIFNIRTADGELLRCIVVENNKSFFALKKYNINRINKISIGRTTDNEIQYEFLNLVSSKHCCLNRHGDSFIIQDSSANGVFVNNRRVKNNQELFFGDVIEIFGLQIIYLYSTLAIGSNVAAVKIDKILELIEPSFIKTEKTYSDNRHITNWFNSSPRFIPKIYSDTLVIEPPSNPQFSKKKSLLQTIGPSLTMAIPMLLGCGIAVIGSAVSGGVSSAFMFTGIITALGSALMGALWAYLNIKSTKRAEVQEENQRFNMYGNYLIDVAEDIKRKYVSNYNAINDMYPSSQVCAGYTADSPELWNRNINQEDFYFCRLGLGDIDFQVDIQIPKEKFSTTYDSLKNKPLMIYENFKVLKNIPIGVDFKYNNLFGIVGGKHKKGVVQIINNIIAQIVANISYTDAKIVFCCKNEELFDEALCEYIKLLPHIWSENKTVRYFARSKQESADVFFELTNILRSRKESINSYSKGVVFKPHYFLFVSDATLFEGEIIEKYIYKNEENLGLTTFILTDYCQNLPNSCVNIIQNDENYSCYYNTLDQNKDVTNVCFDVVDNLSMMNLAKALSNINVREIEDDSSIVSSLDFLEMYGVSSIKEFNIIDLWRKNRTFNSMRVLVGKKAGGANCYLDIHEKFHGPHGLVAGTTGSGKSELVQTFVLSLAINFSPEDVAFFIIDFKGGGMANLFSDLPHLVGKISNLSGNQIGRAMISIKSENLRRQKLFSEYGVNNINSYTRLYKSGEAQIAIPHLIIIIDEFAELKKEEPEFMHELISVAQVGRSLGVHLILATQKPSGTVDDNIWSNAKFRLCLRVQDRQDSNDMLHKPDAAYITQAGRCYLQVGNDEIYELFQSGWSGAPYDENSQNDKSEIATMITTTGRTAVVGSHTKMRRKEAEKRKWLRFLAEQYYSIVFNTDESIDLTDINKLDYCAGIIINKAQNAGYNIGHSNSEVQSVVDFIKLLPKDYSSADEAVNSAVEKSLQSNIKLPENKEKTQLEAIVEYINSLAKNNNYSNNMKLWLPLLKEMISLNKLVNFDDLYNGGWREHSGWSLNGVVGLYDDPKNQTQKPLVINFVNGGHLAVCGSVVSGKSTFLQTLLFSFALKYSPKALNYYIFDFSSGMLSVFENLPHTGGVVKENDLAKAETFFNMMQSLIEERKKLFNGGNYSQYVKVNGVEIPAIFIVIDNFANFKEKTENKFESNLIQISREGVSYGIYLVVSAAGFGLSEIQSRIGDNIKTVIALEMSDKYKYMDLMRTTHLDVMPAPGIKGRGICYVSDRLLEFQTAVAVEAEDDYERNSILEKTVKTMKDNWSGFTAKKIPFIPENPTFDDISSNDEYKDAVLSVSLLPFAYEEENAGVFSIDLFRTYCFSVTGKRRTGKTNLLKILMLSAYAKKSEIVVIENKGNELKQSASAISAAYLSDDKEIYDYFNKLTQEFVKRNKVKNALLNEGKTDDEIYSEMQQFKPIFFFISDIKDFLDSVYHPENGIGAMSGFFENIFEKGYLHNIYFFTCINTDEASALGVYKAYTTFVSHKSGAHLGGNLTSQRIFNFQNIKFNEMSKSMKKGIALLPSYEDDAIAKKVVVPLLGGKGK